MVAALFELRIRSFLEFNFIQKPFWFRSDAILGELSMIEFFVGELPELIFARLLRRLDCDIAVRR